MPKTSKNPRSKRAWSDTGKAVGLAVVAAAAGALVVGPAVGNGSFLAGAALAVTGDRINQPLLTALGLGTMVANTPKTGINGPDETGLIEDLAGFDFKKAIENASNRVKASISQFDITGKLMPFKVGSKPAGATGTAGFGSTFEVENMFLEQGGAPVAIGNLSGGMAGFGLGNAESASVSIM